MAKLWKELNLTEKEKEQVEMIRETGAGAHLPEEKLGEFKTGREKDLTADTRAGKMTVHLYWPVGFDSMKPLPMLVNIHGGGFVKGRRDQDIVFCRNFCSRAGVIVADLDYVPAPAMRFPGQVYACYDALQYLAENAEALGADRSRIALGGHSAGGNLTAAMLLMAQDEGGFVPAMQILDYAGLDMKTPPAEKRNSDRNPRLPIWKSELYNKMYVDPEDAGSLYCSPAFASDEQLMKLPPAVILYCASDIFCDETARYIGRLISAGVPVFSRCFLHSNHGFVVRRVDEYEEAERILLTALRILTESVDRK